MARGYTVTTGVWVRGILQDEYGLDLSQVTWVRSSDEHVAEYRPPANVVLLDEGRDIADMVVSGELAAAIGIAADRPELQPLIHDPVEAAFASLQLRGLYPINHLVVVRDSLLDEHPGLAVGLFTAFAEAKRIYVKRLRDGDIDDPTAADRTSKRVQDVIGDPLPYGLEPNRAMIEKIVDHAVRQQILSRRPALDALFHPSTLDLVA